MYAIQDGTNLKPVPVPAKPTMSKATVLVSSIIWHRYAVYGALQFHYPGNRDLLPVLVTSCVRHRKIFQVVSGLRCRKAVTGLSWAAFDICRPVCIQLVGRCLCWRLVDGGGPLERQINLNCAGSGTIELRA